MNWIERLLHLNPDAGSGLLELSFFIGAFAAAGAIRSLLIAIALAKRAKVT